MFVTTRDSEVTHAVRAGVMAIAPLVVGFAPFALVVGATVGASSHQGAGIAGTWLIFGGSAQIATTRTLESGSAAMAVLTALLIQSRLLVYSASLSQHWREQPLWFRMLAAPMIVDPIWAVADAQASRGGSQREQRAHYFGAALTLAMAWTVLILAGIALGNRLGTSSLQVAAPLCLLSIVGPRLMAPRSRAVGMTAIVAAVWTRGFPSGTSIFVAIVAGCVAGGIFEQVSS